MKTTLFIDGRNFLEKLEDVFELEKKEKPLWHTYNFRGLIDQVLKGITIDEGIFYFAKIKEHPDTVVKSKQLAGELRALKTHLEKQSFGVVLGGTVRGHYKKDGRGKETLAAVHHRLKHFLF